MSCGAVFEVDRDRQHLGVGPARLLPGQGSPERVAAFTEASHASVESPTWSWASRSERPDTPDAAPADAPIQTDSDRIKLKRLEGVVARQRLTNRVLVGVCGLLLLGVFVASMLSRSASNGVSHGGERETNAGARLSPAIEAETRPGVEARAEPAPAPVVDDDPGAMGEEPGWEAVRERVFRLMSDGSSESLSAAVLELETLQRRDRLPAEGVELLERLRTEMDAGRLREVP